MNQSLKKVLFIDDEPEMIEILRAPIKKNGYRFFGANMPVEGIKIATLVKPDLIILDINMPYMSGYEVLRELKNNKTVANIPIVVFSALNEDDVRKRAFGLGAQYVVGKTTPIRDLMKLIAEITGSSQAEQVSPLQDQPLTH